MARRTYGSHPLSDTCSICDEPLGGGRLFRTRAGLVHWACRLSQKGE